MENRITLSATEAANALGISRSKLYEVLRREDADFSFMLGGRRLISRAKLEAWVEKQTENPHSNAGFVEFGGDK